MRTTHKEAKEEEEENRRRIDRGYSAMCILNLRGHHILHDSSDHAATLGSLHTH